MNTESRLLPFSGSSSQSRINARPLVSPVLALNHAGAAIVAVLTRSFRKAASLSLEGAGEPKDAEGGGLSVHMPVCTCGGCMCN